MVLKKRLCSIIVNIMEPYWNTLDTGILILSSVQVEGIMSASK